VLLRHKLKWDNRNAWQTLKRFFMRTIRFHEFAAVGGDDEDDSRLLIFSVVAVAVAVAVAVGTS
jgi:hypothetical protein